MLAELADAQFGDGNAAASALTSAEAIEVARRRTHRISEAHACIIRARSLVRTGVDAARGELPALLSRANYLIQVSGARVLDKPLAAAEAEVETALQ